MKEIHNCGRLDGALPDGVFDWAHRFDDAVREQLAPDPADILAVRAHGDHARAVPTPDRFIPLLYLAAIASASEPAREVVRGYSLDSLSMCHAAGAKVHAQEDGLSATPLPASVPAEHTNT